MTACFLGKLPIRHVFVQVLIIGLALTASVANAADCNSNGVADELDLVLPIAESKAVASDGEGGENFGRSISISEDTAVIGAPYADSVGDWSGSAYVLQKDGSNWVEQDKLITSDTGEGDRFGCSVSISGDVALVGAYADDDRGIDSGSAYVFRRNGSDWVEEAKLTASDGASSDYFGLSVSISGHTAVIGAYGDGAQSGSAYVFRWNGAQWIEEAKLTASDAAFLDSFGASISTSDNVIVIGAYYDDDGGSNSGSAYVFRRDGSDWVEEAKLTANDAAAKDWFGYSVSISGDAAVIGAHQDDSGGYSSGSAYVFRWNGLNWVQESKLTASDATGGDHFGRSVSISGDIAVIGASGDDDRGSDSGSAYVFHWNGTNWVERSKLVASDGLIDDFFGYAVSISGDTAAIGAYGNNGAAYKSGSAYMFQPASRDCNGNSVPDECDIESSSSQDCNINNVPDECDIDGDTSPDLNGNNTPDECEVDCNANGVPDDWDITQGTSQDCNVNSMPDECDITTEDSLDCNGNGMPDECDIASTISQDCNANSVPDECDLMFPGRQSKLFASDAAEADYFGCSVSISGDVAAIGARGNEDRGINSGSAYMFRLEGLNWIEQSKLTANNGTAGDSFGGSVAISRDVAVIGASGKDGAAYDSGSAYVYRWNGFDWIEEAELTASDAASSDSFGSSVAISRDVVVIGARYDDDGGSNSGSAYVFRWDGSHWIEEAKLTASDAAARDWFGHSVSVSGNAALIGAYGNDGSAYDTGSAYVFRWNGTDWVEESKLTASDAASDDRFGGSVCLNANIAVIGAYWDDDAGDDSGSAYVFRWSGTDWVQESKLIASDAVPDDHFGSSVSISSDVAVIGAAGNDGAAYVFRRNGSNWAEESKLVASDAAVGDLFAASVSISGDIAVIGAYFDDDAGNASGSAYIFHSTSKDSNGNSIPDECDPDSDGDGVPDDSDACANTVAGSTVDTNGCPPSFFGDFNRDGDVDGDDYVLFEGCASGSGVPHDGSLTCQKADCDNDNDVDQSDFGQLQRCYAGEGVPADLSCMD